jgi:hypothetical protein
MTVAVLALALASIVLAACGSSSSSTTATQSASATAATPGSGSTATTPGAGTSTAPGGLGSRFTAFRECMQKQGITLPKRKPGQPGGGVLGGGPQLPAGVTRAQYEAALTKCGSLRPRFGGGTGGPGQRFRSPAFTAALVKFGACMREHGIALPAPNTTGKGPVFSTTAINTASPQFRAAESKCAPLLRQGFSRPGATVPPGEGGQAG